MATTKADILAAAQTVPAVAAAIAAQDATGIWAAMPPEIRRVKAAVGAGTIIAVLGTGAGGGGQFLKKLRTGNLPAELAQYADDFEEVMRVIDRGDFDCGSDGSRAMFDVFVSAGMITADQAAALKALGENPVQRDEMEIRSICWSDDGVWQL